MQYTHTKTTTKQQHNHQSKHYSKHPFVNCFGNFMEDSIELNHEFEIQAITNQIQA